MAESLFIFLGAVITYACGKGNLAKYVESDVNQMKYAAVTAITPQLDQ